MTSFIKQKTATFSRPRIIVKYMDTLLTSKPLTTATPVDGYAIVDGDIVLFTNLSAINYTIHRATVTGVNITWTQLALGQSADGLPALGDEVFIQAGTYTKKIYWYDGVSFIEFKSGGGIGDSSIFGYLNSQDDNVTTQPFTTGNNATFLTAGTFIGSFNQKNETNPLNGKSSYTYTQGATSINDWIASYPITVPLKAKGVTNVTKLSYMYDGGNSDILPVVYDVTNSKILSSTTKYLENTNGVTKRCELVYDVPSTCSSIKIGFHVKVTNNGKILKFDDIETGVWTPQAVNLVEQESVVLKKNAAQTIPGSGVETVVQLDSTSDSSRYPLTSYGIKILSSGNYTIKLKGEFGANSDQAYLGYKINSSTTVWGNVHVVDANPSGSYSHFSDTFKVQLNVNDIIYFYAKFGTATARQLNNAEMELHLVKISENVVQSYAPSDFLGEIKLLPSTTAPKGFIPADGKSIGKTSGNYQGDAYYALYALRWAMASTTAGEPYVISSAKGVSAQADWDAGKTITIDVRGLFFRAAGGNAGAVGSKQLDAFQGHKHEIQMQHAASVSSMYGQGDTTYGSILTYNTPPTSGKAELTSPASFQDGTNGTPHTSSETRPINTSEYAYMRYGTSAPDLYALPTSKENVFSARIFSTGVVNSKNADWINSITLSDTSLYTIDISKLGLTTAPQVNVSTVRSISTGNRPRHVYVTSSTPTSITIRTGYTDTISSNFVFDADAFEIKIQKQYPDYTAPGVFVGNVAKNQVVTVEGRTSSPQTIGTSATALILNSLVGDSTIATLSSNQITLQAGEYDVQWNIPVFSTSAGLGASGWNYNYLYNVTDASEVRRGDPAFGSTTVSFMQSNKMGNAKLTLTAAKVFELRSISTQSAGFYVGTGGSSPNDLASWVKITKLNGQ